MRAAIYNPYLDTLGGGERYSMAFASALKQKGYLVDVEWKDDSIRDKLENRFGIKLDNIEFIKNIKKGENYDLCFWVSDGSIPLLRARKNILHFQIPFKDVNGRNLLNKMKLFRINKIVCNSYFTKNIIDAEFGVESEVLYPPTDTSLIKSKRKENIILSVGRFSQLKQAKNQHILVECFKKIFERGFSGWKLVLAGGVEVGVDDYLEKIKKSAKSFPIEIVKSPKFDELKILYGKSKIFWSAAGFGVNEQINPEKVEHFGITLIEAMSAGCVPIAFDAGGHKEIIADNFNGYLWNTKREFLKKSKDLMNNGRLLREISKKAKESSKVYEYERFEAEVFKLL